MQSNGQLQRPNDIDHITLQREEKEWSWNLNSLSTGRGKKLDTN